MRSAIRNGSVIREDEAVLPIVSKAVQYSFSVYEALRILDGKVVHLDDHLYRLRESAAAINLKTKVSDEDIALWIDKLIAADSIKDATMRILLVGGDLDILFITHQPLLSYPDSYYSEGIKCTTYHGERFLPLAKTSNLLMSYLALEEAKSLGSFEALFVDRDGYVTEGTRSNFYALRGNSLYTAPDDAVLGGVTRISVIRAAKELGLNIVYEKIKATELYTYDSMFISSTSMAAMPISDVDNIPVNKSRWDDIIAIRDMVRLWEL